MAIPPIFWFLRRISDISIAECLSTFNWGIGLYLIAGEADVDRLRAIGRFMDYPTYHLGHVEDGEPKTVVHTTDGVVTVYPPGE